MEALMTTQLAIAKTVTDVNGLNAKGAASHIIDKSLTAKQGTLAMITRSPIANGVAFSAGPSATSLLVALLSRARIPALKAWHAYRAYRNRQKAKAHLMSFDAHLLSDIGIDRRAIDSVLRGRAQEHRRDVGSPSVLREVPAPSDLSGALPPSERRVQRK
jgi:uncharacterized protein YjiS (DUF1127 family)